jgi:hypothetical protein
MMEVMKESPRTGFITILKSALALVALVCLFLKERHGGEGK